MPTLALATRLFAPEPTPAAFRQEALAIALEQAGAEVLVLTTSAPGAEGHRDRVRHVSRFPVKRDRQGHVRGYVSYMSFDLPLVLRLLAARDLQAIVSEPPPTTGLAVMAASWIRGVPYVYYAADVWADATETVPGVPLLVRRTVRAMENLVWRRASLILAISPGVAGRVRELIGMDAPIAMIGNGIDTEAFTIEGPRAAEPGPFFVYTGTISEWHGAAIFLDAFALLREEHPQARLLFFSEGAEKDAFARTVAERGIQGVEFRRKLPAVEVAAYVRAATAALSSVVPGRGYDFALPTKIYAATACGTPVIHTGQGAATQLVREGGLGWAPDYDARAIARAMAEAIEGAGTPDPRALRSWTEDHSSLQSSAREGAEAILDLLQAEEPVTARRRRLRTRAVRGSLALVGALGAALAVRSGRRNS